MYGIYFIRRSASVSVEKRGHEFKIETVNAWIQNSSENYFVSTTSSFGSSPLWLMFFIHFAFYFFKNTSTIINKV